MINDTQGHAVGDMVLSQTGSILSEVTGDCGFVGRLGGDEFAVFVSGFENTVEMEEFCVTMRESLKKIIFDMEYLISCTFMTHNAIHYGDENSIMKGPVERKPFDTCPWKK